MENPGIDTRVSPSLHPDNIKNIEGYDDQTKPYVAAAETALSEAYEGVRAVHTAREKAKTNPTWNEAMQIIQTDIFAQKILARVCKRFDATRVSLDKAVTALEEELSAPVTSKAESRVSSEIRSFVRNLSTDKRFDFMDQAVREKDFPTLGAVLSAPPYLSGLDSEVQRAYVRQYREMASPELAQRLKAMRGAKELIENNAGVVFRQMEQAVGASSQKAKALREAKTVAEQALAIKEL